MIVDPRFMQILDALQDLAAGNFEQRLEISPAHDELDALAHAVNVVGSELDYATRKLSRAREEAEQANAAKTVFLRNISHELRTPLSVILGIAELLRLDGVPEARRHELYALILSNGRAQAELLDDVLDLSQIEAGKLAIEPVPLLVRDLLGEVAESLEPAAARNGNVLVVESPADLHVLADRRRTRQILVNVIGNAIKFTANGRIAVRARGSDGGVAIDVEDTGIGVEAANVERVFEPFMQADPSIGRHYGGSGLGLALSRRLAREMAGDLAILDTRPGTGTTLRLSLREWRSSDGASDHEPTALAAARGLTLDGVCVLVVDDHDDLRAPTAMLLAARGATVLEAASGSEAVELGARDGIDLIVMDVRMPDIDGLEATRRLRAKGVGTPIVALTADVLADREIYARAGCTGHLAKPVDVDRLITMIRGLSEGRGG